MILYFMLISGLLILSIKSIIAINYKRLAYSSFNMSKTKVRTLKRIKNAYEEEFYKSQCMNDTDMFTCKHILNIRTLGMRLATWESILMFCVLAGLTAGAYKTWIVYSDDGKLVSVATYVLYGIAIALVPVIVDMVFNIKKSIEILHVNLCEYFENSFRVRLEIKGNGAPVNMIETANRIDDGLKELMTAMQTKPDSNICAENVSSNINLNKDEEKVLSDILEEYLG